MQRRCAVKAVTAAQILANLAASDIPDDDDECMTAGQVAVMFDVSVEQVRHWSDDGLLPFYRTEGGHRRYRLSDIQDATSREDPT
jgi:excisionase family DNA binding protein